MLLGGGGLLCLLCLLGNGLLGAGLLGDLLGGGLLGGVDLGGLGCYLLCCCCACYRKLRLGKSWALELCRLDQSHQVNDESDPITIMP